MSVLGLLARRQPGAAPAALDAAEAAIGEPLPSQLRTFLAVCDGGQLTGLELALPDGTSTAGFDLLPLVRIVDFRQQADFGGSWPWAMDAGGNLVTVTSDDQLHFWDHDTDGLTALGKVFDDFDQLVSALPPDEPAPPAPDAASRPDEALIHAIQYLDAAAALPLVAAVADRELLSFALNLSARHGFDTVVTALIDRGADLEWRQRPGTPTPLLQAAVVGHLETVRLLVARGADRRARSDRGETPLQVAQAMGHQAVVDFLASIDGRS